jgi:cytochrome c peroxidase
MTTNLRTARAVAALPFIVGIGIFTGLSAATAAIVGQATSVAVPKSAVATIDQLRHDYKRPDMIAFPADNPYTIAKVALGKTLYFDTRLSRATVQSCASCHSPSYGWGDGQPKGVGDGMKTLGRRSPTIINAGYGRIFMWDGRAASLEEQALGPIQADVEMNMPLDKLLARLNGIPGYAPMFAAAFPNEGIKAEHIAKAIATYERTVVSAPAPFDAWVAGSDKAISEEAKRGFVLFNTKGECVRCHSGWTFTDDSFHDIGLATDDIGRGKFLPQIIKMKHAFKTPGLREIARRGPYMHDGSLATLEAVVEHYDKGGVERESRSDLIRPLGLSAQEKKDLVAFMLTLTGEVDPINMPVLPR